MRGIVLAQPSSDRPRSAQPEPGSGLPRRAAEAKPGTPAATLLPGGSPSADGPNRRGAEAGGAECRRVKPEPRCSCTHGPSCKVRACMTGTPETDVLSVRNLSVWVCSPSTARGSFPTNRQLNKKPRLREGHGRPGWLAPHPGFGPWPPAPQALVAGPGRSSASGPASATSY